MIGLEYLNEAENLNLRIRIGINTGTVIAGVIGSKNAVYDIWGDTGTPPLLPPVVLSFWWDHAQFTKPQSLWRARVCVFVLVC